VRFRSSGFQDFYSEWKVTEINRKCNTLERAESIEKSRLSALSFLFSLVPQWIAGFGDLADFLDIWANIGQTSSSCSVTVFVPHTKHLGKHFNDFGEIALTYY